MLSAEQLLTADELETTTVEVPEWGRGAECTVMLRVMDGLAMSAYQARLQEAQVPIEPGDTQDEEAQAQARADAQHSLRRRLMVEYCAACIIDAGTGELVFDTPAKIDVLGRKNGKGLQRVFSAATALHRDDAEGAEAFSKNSERTPAGGSGGSTPSSTDSDTPIDCSGS